MMVSDSNRKFLAHSGAGAGYFPQDEMEGCSSASCKIDRSSGASSGGCTSCLSCLWYPRGIEYVPAIQIDISPFGEDCYALRFREIISEEEIVVPLEQVHAHSPLLKIGKLFDDGAKPG